MEIDNRSRIRVCGSYTKESCGYCKGGHAISYGAVSENLLPEDYESLMLVGWRRAGTFLYKPTMHKVIQKSYCDDQI